MGDRAQLVIKRDDTKIYFYTHWLGSYLPRILADGLRRGKPRWSDPSYLGRILFCELVSHGDLMGETGFGISTQYGDSYEDTDLIVDMNMKLVHYMDKNWSFSEYINLHPTWRTLRGQ